MLGRFRALNLALIAAIALAVLLLLAQRTPSRGIEIIRGTPPSGVDVVLVHLSGAVAAPGVIEANRGDRVLDVIERAGGLQPDADPAGVNLARRVRDEDQLHVPRIGEGPPLLDLNSATASDLEELPGIGPVYAGRIIEARAALPFASSDELVERELIPAHLRADPRPGVGTVTPPPSPYPRLPTLLLLAGAFLAGVALASIFGAPFWIVAILAAALPAALLVAARYLNRLRQHVRAPILVAVAILVVLGHARFAASEGTRNKRARHHPR